MDVAEELLVGLFYRHRSRVSVRSSFGQTHLAASPVNGVSFRLVVLNR